MYDLNYLKLLSKQIPDGGRCEFGDRQFQRHY